MRGLIYDAISEERWRQDSKFPDDWKPGGVTTERKYLILAEEVGEVATAILEGDWDNLRVELVQVAAVCVAWLESEDHPKDGPQRPIEEFGR